MIVGGRVHGGRESTGEKKLDSCNSIISKIYLKIKAVLNFNKIHVRKSR